MTPLTLTSDTPTSHCICFGNTIHNDRTLFHFGELCYALMLADIVDMFVNLIGNHNNLRILCQYCGQACQLLLAVHRTRRVRGRAKNQRLCLRGDGSLQLCRCYLKVLVDTGRDDNRRTLSQLYHFRITDPIGSRYNYFVTRIYQYQDCIANRLLGTIGARNLCGGIFQTVFLLQLLYNYIT